MIFEGIKGVKGIKGWLRERGGDGKGIKGNGTKAALLHSTGFALAGGASRWWGELREGGKSFGMAGELRAGGGIGMAGELRDGVRALGWRGEEGRF